MNRRYLIALVGALVLAGCGKGEEGKHASQTAAKVNGEEITVHQVNYVAAQVGKIPADQLQATSNQILSSLIDKELLRQKAVDAKLDRSPEVVQALDAARREILSKAYLEDKFKSVSTPTDAEIQDYYKAHPELFSERRVYKLQEIAIQAGDRALQVKQQIAAAKSIDALLAWLKQENIPVTGGSAVKSAEQLPLDMLPRLARLSDGQSLMMEGHGRLTLLVMLGSQPQPVDMDKAKPAIVQFLTNNKRQAIAKSEIETLRKDARIVYMGNFTDPRAAAAATAPAPAPAKAAPAAAPSAAAQSNAMDKGIAGLK